MEDSPKIRIIDRRESRRGRVFYENIFPKAPLRDCLPYDIQDGFRVADLDETLYVFDDEWRQVSNERSVYDGESYNIVKGSDYEWAWNLGERIENIKRRKNIDRYITHGSGDQIIGHIV